MLALYGNLAGDGLPRTIKTESKDTNSWLMVPSDSLKQNERKGDAFPNDDEDDYVVLSQDDVVEGVAAFVAKLILANPRAKVKYLLFRFS
jgi:hypothetical protein